MNDKLKKGSILIDSYRRVKTEQNAAMSRLKNIQGNVPRDELLTLEEIIYYPYDAVVDSISHEISLLSEDINVYQSFLKDISGLTIFDSLQLLVILKNPEKFKDTSHLWSFAGLAPVKYCTKCGKRYFETEEKAKDWYWKHKTKGKKTKSLPFCTCFKSSEHYFASNRRIKGMNPDYNEELKKLVIMIGNKFLQREGYYKNMFLNYRDMEYQKNNELTDIHIENRAKRKMVKLFLHHLLENWKESEGIQSVDSYMRLPKYKEEV